MSHAAVRFMDRLRAYLTDPRVTRIAAIVLVVILAACNNNTDGGGPGGY